MYTIVYAFEYNEQDTTMVLVFDLCTNQRVLFFLKGLSTYSYVSKHSPS